MATDLYPRPLANALKAAHAVKRKLNADLSRLESGGRYPRKLAELDRELFLLRLRVAFDEQLTDIVARWARGAIDADVAANDVHAAVSDTRNEYRTIVGREVSGG